MRLFEAGRAATREIAAYPVRSALSFAAVSVGTASLFYTLAQTRGMQDALRRNIELMGPGAMSVTGRRGYVSKGQSPGLTYDDAFALRRELPDLPMVFPRLDRGSQLRYGDQKLRDVIYTATTPEWGRRNWVYSLRGRFLNDRDVADAARVVVVVEPATWVHKPFWAEDWDYGGTLRELASHHDLYGRRVLLNGRLFTVVGVLRPPPYDKDPRWDFWDTPQLLVPITTAEYVLRWPWEKRIPHEVSSIEIDAGSERAIAVAKARVKNILLARHREEDFEIHDRREEIESRMSEQRKDVTAALVLGLVAMVCGGVGIMNVTLAAIFSRVQEIGVRRALGATQLDVMAQFVAEAALLGLAGGLAGLALGGAGIAWLASHTSRDLAEMTWTQAASLTAFSSLLSALFAAPPAWRASRLDPVEALRSEA